MVFLKRNCIGCKLQRKQSNLQNLFNLTGYGKQFLKLVDKANVSQDTKILLFSMSYLSFTRQNKHHRNSSKYSSYSLPTISVIEPAMRERISPVTKYNALKVNRNSSKNIKFRNVRMNFQYLRIWKSISLYTGQKLGKNPNNKSSILLFVLTHDFY